MKPFLRIGTRDGEEALTSLARQKKYHSVARLAFSLVEVTIALGIAAFCLIAMLGLFLTGLNADHATLQQMSATSLAVAVASDFQATPANSRTPRFQIPLPTTTTASSSPTTLFFADDGTTTNATSANPTGLASAYRVDISYGTRISNAQPAPVRILVTWPALANPTGGIWPINASGAVQTVVSTGGSVYP